MTARGKGRTPDEVRAYMRKYMRAVRKGIQRPGKRSAHRLRPDIVDPVPDAELGTVRKATYPAKPWETEEQK